MRHPCASLGSNESNQNVFFDNIVVSHKRGPVVEQSDYYAFGYQIPGLSSMSNKGSDYALNRKKYNGIEETKELELEQYDAFYRNLDPLTGRWWQIDPKIDAGYEDLSPYTSMNDDPVLHSDPLGDEVDNASTCCKVASSILKGTAKVAAVTVGVGLGPEDPVADGIAGGELVVGVTVAALVGTAEFIFDPNYKPSENPGAWMTPILKNSSVKQTSDGLTAKEHAELYRPLTKPVDIPKSAKTGSIYKVPGNATTSGKPYIGRHNKPNPAKTRKSNDERDRKKPKL